MISWTRDSDGRPGWEWTGDAFLLPCKGCVRLCRPYRSAGGTLGWAVLAEAGSAEELKFACSVLDIKIRKQNLAAGNGKHTSQRD